MDSGDVLALWEKEYGRFGTDEECDDFIDNRAAISLAAYGPVLVRRALRAHRELDDALRWAEEEQKRPSILNRASEPRDSKHRYT